MGTFLYHNYLPFEKKRRNPSFELYLVEMEQFPLQLQEQNEREETQR